jgi:transposase
MQTITTIGLDIAKSVFQVHGVDAGGQVVIRRQLKRRHALSFFQSCEPHQKAEHMAAPTNAAKCEESSCQPGANGMDPALQAR